VSGTWSFRPLLLFWAVVIGLLAGGAVGLQFLGPVDVPVRSARPRQTVIAQDPALPAHVAPSSANPVPPLPMTTTSIPEPDPALLEPGTALPDRLLPRAAGGRSPAQAYAAAFDPAERHPRVALVIDGAGLDRGLTGQAIASLPSAVDLAFSAYAPPDVSARLARQARAGGRECLVSVPMEPQGFPAADEGDRALRIGGEPSENRRDLEWALSGVAGCVGATGGSDGLGGERFAESRQEYADMLGAVAGRGLLYLDPRPGAPAPPGLAPGLAADGRAPRVVDVIVDPRDTQGDPADAQAIDRNLAALEAVAARRGAAIGLAGPPRPVLLDRIAVWAHGLAARGIVLAPLTAIPAPRGAGAGAAP
jgi:polysaccharide deacetylase 2 family uncharacterized protein YibQ